MFSLQKFFSKDASFYDLLEESAAKSSSAAEYLGKVIANPSDEAALEGLRQSRHASKLISEQVSELIVKTFVTALDKEDIEALSAALYKIPKPMEKFAERYVMSHALIPDITYEKQIALLGKATKIVEEMVLQIRKGLKLEKIQGLNASLQRTEAEGDHLELELLRELYTTPRNSLKIIIIKDQYGLLEKVIDRCRDAGNVIAHIFLKNS